MSSPSACTYISSDNTIEVVNHVFECIAALRESVERAGGAVSDETALAETVVSTLTADVSKLFRNATCGSYPPVFCPAHGELEVITVGSKRHSEVLDVDFKVGGMAGIVCRNCMRESVLHDIKFNFCRKCKYVRCMFCVPRGAIHWRTLRCLLEANPASAGTLFPGSRLLLHELVALVPEAGGCGEVEAMEVVKLVLAMHPTGARLSDNNGDLPIHWACCGNSVACLRLMIEAYPDGLQWPNSKGMLPIHIACRGCNVAIVQQLLQSFPSPSGLDKISASGNLPLHLAVSGQKIIPDIVLACMNTFPNGIRTQNKKTKQLPLHLALSNRDYPDMLVVRALLEAYPASALLPIGQEAELPLHLVLSRPVPSIPALYALLDISPESALTASSETAWSSAETPIALAHRKAAAAQVFLTDDSDPEVHRAKWVQWTTFRHATRVMLSRNRRYDPATLRNLTWEDRKQAILMCYGGKNKSAQNILWRLSETIGVDVARKVIGFL